MAGEWLKFECSLPEKPETLAITSAMGWDDPDLTVGKLMRLFRWFDQHTTTGNADGVTPALLDRVIGAQGFVSALVSVGWIVLHDNGLALHNFENHNGATAKSRAQTAKRVANHRTNAVGNADAVTDALAREEKKRKEEEEKQKRAAADAAALLAGAKPKTKTAAVEIDTWIDATDGDAIPADDPIFEWAEKAGIPAEFLELSWFAFAEDMRAKHKRQKDWRAHYRNAVRGNWLKLWFYAADGECRLTTAGEQARRAQA